MIAFHVGAATLAPKTTLYGPPGRSTLSCACLLSSGVPTHTAVVSCGVYPTNQVSLFLSVVPVLPAAIRPPLSLLAEPVPPGLRTAVMMLATPWATSGSTTCWQFLAPGLSNGSSLPSGPRMLWIGTGVQCTPFEAKEP